MLWIPLFANRWGAGLRADCGLLVGLVGLFFQGLGETELPVDPQSLCASWMHSNCSAHGRWHHCNYQSNLAHILWLLATGLVIL